MDYINELDKRIKLKDGINVIEKALELIYFLGPLSSKSLARELSLPIPVITALKKECLKLGIWEEKNGISSTVEGNRYLSEECGFGGINKEKYISILQSEEVQKGLIKSLAKKYSDLFNLRPSVDVTIDQAKCTTETAFKRAMLCLLNGSLIGKRVLCVGDDDLISVAMGLLLKSIFNNINNINTRISIFELDERYIEYIQKLSRDYSLPIECINIDLKKPLPLSVINSFDCFFTDPPYTVDGVSLFLSRGVSALKPGKGKKVFLSFANKPINERYSLQKCIHMHGLTIKEILPSFNEYEGASLLGGVGQMMILESTDQMTPLIPLNKEYINSIYTREKKLPNSTYTCRNCKKVFKIGKGNPYNTIEELKNSGCTFCRGKSFDKNLKKFSERNLQNKPLGKHILAEFYGCEATELDNPENIRIYMRNAAIKGKATIVNESFHKFNPWGVSGVIVIKESHLTIHTWPEYCYAAVDLFTCGENVDVWAAFDYLKDKLKCNNIEFSNIMRGNLDIINQFK